MTLSLTSFDYENLLHFAPMITASIPHVRSTVLQQMAHTFGFTHSVFWRFNDQHQLCDPITHQLPDTFITQYMDVFHHMDTLHPIHHLERYRNKPCASLLEGHIQKVYDGSPYQTQYLQRYHFHDQMTVLILHHQRPVGVIMVFQPTHLPPFHDLDRQRLQHIAQLTAPCVSLCQDTTVAPNTNPTHAPKLTAREKEIVQLVKKGYTNARISQELFISINTVKKHLAHIFDKCKVSNRVHLLQIVS